MSSPPTPCSPKINWKAFEGSSHAEEGLGLFAVSKLSYRKFEEWFLPHMPDLAEVVRTIKNNKKDIKSNRRNAARGFRRICGASPFEYYE